MIRLSTHSSYFEEIRREWSIDKDVCRYNEMEKILDENRYAIKESYKDILGVNIESGDDLGAIIFGIDYLNAIIVASVTFAEVATNPAYDLYAAGVIGKQLYDNTLNMTKNLANLQERQYMIQQYCNSSEPEVVMQGIDFDKGTTYDKVETPRTDAPSSDTDSGNIMVA